MNIRALMKLNYKLTLMLGLILGLYINIRIIMCLEFEIQMLGKQKRHWKNSSLK